MVTNTSEAAFEAHIEESLLAQGYQAGQSKDYDSTFCIDNAKFWGFLENTQKAELDKLRDRPNWQRLVLERLDRKIKNEGLLHVVKKGLSIDDAHLTLFYDQPYNDLNPKVVALFASNIFSVTRQLFFSDTAAKPSIDMVIFINGLAIATFELKKPSQGQTVYHAKKQYKDRDPSEPIFAFARCLVHFAVDTREAWMTTHVSGKSTYFLPFNQGYQGGKGNPPNPNGFMSAYLWEEVLTRPSLTNILMHFAKQVIEKDIDTGKNKKLLFFPRYHQLQVVRMILAHAKKHGPGHEYLIQHSAGSGKSNSITWAAYQLIELYGPDGKSNVFDSVIVVTDRTNLDKQLRDNIKQFAEVKNIVAHAKSSADLKKHLDEGKRVIITTIQKFPFIVDGIQDMANRNFGVIIDEAHSSQSGQTADKLNMTLKGSGEEEPEDLQEMVLKAMEGRKMSKNASYFAFTATPKNATLEKFGWQDTDGKFHPFHLYSMKQAIEEDFIKDVLANYTTYKSYYEIQKSIKDNPFFDSVQAQKRLKSFVEGHPDTIKDKAKIMIEHFLGSVVGAKKLKGKAKGMVVTRNIESAIRYYQAIQAALVEAKAPFKAVIAFSGKKLVDGIEHTEDSLNGFSDKDTPTKLKTDEYRLLVVANKYLTGFDEPLLHTMYVDKKLQEVTAVQALSRLNRCNPNLGKEDTFVLDFYNSVEDIKTAFDPFYTSTSLGEPTDVNVLHDLKEKLDEQGIYEWVEVEEFNLLFFTKAPADQLEPIIQKAVPRFEELEEEAKKDFKIKAKQFVKIYAQVACIMPYNNANWEMLHWFLKFLIPELIVKDPEGDQLDAILETIDLSTYGLETVREKYNIELDPETSEVNPQNPNPRGVHGTGGDKSSLDEIIEAFNKKWFDLTGRTPEEIKIFITKVARSIAGNKAYSEQVADNPDQQNRQIALDKMIQKAMSQISREEQSIFRLFASDDEFKRTLNNSLKRILTQGGAEFEELLEEGNHVSR
ncbi:MAG: DEAD/DEAH box helicase [Candidatus Lambdaproteobacteria bacterium RIFOXYD2_FULL_50_16]|uniref:DEAD/DEAH box helicase n=1 Tax=Candidatus Lambdaproteobacteria bacterium RIFOXYD2_FULL_50_16 TaxID=1817772 RepID=A0A1F6G9L2_9PROT|nr:MAG: DEAD/DEAH box helicase [Candidatus Lambdaproteobacteria bacterium RIFOXYD2_FULL_50_16]